MKQKRMFFCEMNEQPSDIVLEAEISGKVRQMAAFTNYYYILLLLYYYYYY